MSSCLALSLQPVNGSANVLLQTREWFPPSRALFALSSFRHTRLSLLSKQQQQQPPSDILVIGDDPLAASSGQIVVGVESRYRIVYRLVNTIYVLAITSLDEDESTATNVFECIHIVNQAVSVLVSACRGVDVTPEKLARKYAEVYMALDIVLRGVTSVRLSAMLSSIHGESLAKLVHSGIDSEAKIRGADSWPQLQHHSLDRSSGVSAFSGAQFEIPPETLEAGDLYAVSIVPASASTDKEIESESSKNEEEEEGPKDPFAASDNLNKPQELVGGFKKNKDPSATDLTLALVGLEVPALPPAEATQSTNIQVEGFEGNYGGIEFDNEPASFSETFQGFDQAWGGGLDASEFVGSTKVQKPQGLGGLELLQTGDSGDAVKAKAAEASGMLLENVLVQKKEMKGPEMFIVEEINAEFRESILARVGVMGVVYLRTLPPKKEGDKETEFSFRVDGTGSVKRFVMHSSTLSSLGNGLFHVRTAASDEPLPIMKYSLLPKSTPLPLRVRLTKRHSGTLLSVMIQYVSNPELPGPLNDVTFVLKLPIDPTLLKVSPKAILNRSEKELKWIIPEIPLNGAPGRLRVRMPVDTSAEDGDEEIEVVAHVKFSWQGYRSLSGVCLRAATEGKTDFYEVDHMYESGVYMCN
ncbi:hypothetical protein MLD38_015265 [Melastoma candidum]|uniref:Uncharacterized protein n=1 Tax=Melastoma candidum TaxID=119954 RepID=A0ACB9RGQ6_9MYRT|nr:hypothetical protein MLD38_015265 [Melastoma candidum]